MNIMPMFEIIETTGRVHRMIVDEDLAEGYAWLASYQDNNEAAVDVLVELLRAPAIIKGAAYADV